MFEICVRNPITQEYARFLGQGETMAAAVKDGLDGVGKVFRPKNDGKERKPGTLAVVLANGEVVNRTVANFESETPYHHEENEH